MKASAPVMGLVLLSGILLAACVDLYKVEIETDKSYLIVEGTVNNLPDRQVVSIFRTKTDAVFKSSEFTSTIVAQKGGSEPVAEARVVVIENGQTRYDLTETEPGYYEMPASFLGRVGSTYQLSIETAAGQKYLSSIETISPVPPIARIYDRYNAKGIFDRSTSVGQIATNDFYVDFQDPADQRNFYRWTSITYEIQKICATCRGGRYYVTTNDGECRTDSDLSVNNFFDYECKSLCWDIFYGSSLDIFSDVYTNGKLQKDKLVAQIPVYQSNPALVVVRQMSLSPDAYRYYKLVQDQSVNTGSLADTPPAPIRGNISNTSDEAELVLGYFSASEVAENRYWLERRNTVNAQPNGLFASKNGRDPNFELPSSLRSVIPLADCLPSNSRTPNSPSGWRF
ncbi:DUF4249 domain-containing protein [Persicitalea jodogahamensis]|uniref:DUF4249 domain-containing protein n=1 Tax=Persicitalea jodogahamensis TaxID=402147 RepID=A0A8J3GAV5_9BACT|nr:DUF4249 domain-containing protein [Persicitalea jodogahamensis]GHB77403.1 hypothetical protein GCM10007390_34370 [Persicitalea jodogahamensis]